MAELAYIQEPFKHLQRKAKGADMALKQRLDKALAPHRDSLAPHRDTLAPHRDRPPS